MKKLAIALSVLAALMLGASANAETIDYTVTGWQTTCSATQFTGKTNNCTTSGFAVGRLSGGTITGSAQFVGDSTSGGTLTITSIVYVTSSTPGVGPATITVTDGWFTINGAGVVTGGGVGVGLAGGTFSCTPTADVICNTPNTPLAVASIDIYGLGNNTVVYLVQALASASTNLAWQEYTLVPEPGVALLGGAALLSLVVVGSIRRRRSRK